MKTPLLFSLIIMIIFCFPIRQGVPIPSTAAADLSSAKPDLRQYDRIRVTIINAVRKKITIHAEVAATRDQRALGLMFRHSLKSDHGMLFVFDTEHRANFWMKDTWIPLSLAYIDRNRKITQIFRMEPESMQIYSSDYKVLYALEVNRNFFQRNLIYPGAEVRFEPY